MRQAPDLIEALVKIYPIIKCLFKTLQLFAYEYEWPPNRHRCNGDWHSKITSINLGLIICRYICLEIKCSGNIQCSKWRSCVSMMYYLFSYLPNSFQFSSVTQLRLTLCNPMDGSTPGLPPCPSPTPGVYSNSCPLSQWCHPTISSCRPFLLPPSIFPSNRVFSNESVLCIRSPKYWSFSFSISPSNFLSTSYD